MTFIVRLGNSAEAAAAIEFGLIAALIAVAAVAAMTNAGRSVENSLNTVDEQMSLASQHRFETR
jgi:pilus assembly protein Flp/PilA